MTDDRRALLRLLRKHSLSAESPPDEDLVDKILAKIKLSNERQTREQANNRC